MIILGCVLILLGLLVVPAQWLVWLGVILVVLGILAYVVPVRGSRRGYW